MSEKDSTQQLLASDLIVNQADPSEHFSEVFVFEADHIEEANLGNLYITGEISGTREEEPDAVTLLNELASTIKRSYYQVQSSTPTKSLERALKSANQFFEKQSAEKKLKWLESLHIVVAALMDGTLYVTQTGDNGLYLFRGIDLHRINTDSSSIDTRPGHERLFAKIAIGEVRPTDRLFVITPSLSYGLPEDRMKGFIESYHPSKGKHYERAFLNQNIESGAMLVLADFTSAPMVDEITVQEAQGYESAQHTQSDEQKSSEQQVEIAERVGDSMKRIASITNQLAHMSTKGVASAQKHARRGVKAVKIKAQSLKDTPHEALPAQNSHPQDNPAIVRKQAYLKIPLHTNSLMILKDKVGYIAAAALLLGGAGMIYQSFSTKGLSFYQEQLAESEHITASLSDLVFQDQTLAADKIDEVRQILAGVQESGYLQDEVAQLISQVESYEQTLEAGVNNGISVAIDFANTSLAFVPIGVTLFNNSLIIYDQNTFYKHNLESRKGSFVFSNIPNTARYEMGIDLMGEDTLALYSPRDTRLALFDLDDNSAQELDVALSGDNANMVDIGTFNRNVYLLDTNNSQIVRYSAGDYANPGTWLSASASESLRDPVSFAIDGDIYILQKNGVLKKYNRGTLKSEFEFKLPGSVSVFSRIYTHEDLAHIYILDVQSNSIIKLNKETITVDETVTDPRFTSLRNFYFDLEGEKYYVVAGLKIIQIPLEK